MTESDQEKSALQQKTQDDLRAFFLDVNKETDRGMALVGAALLDENLACVLQAFMCDPTAAKKLVRELNGPLSQFSARIEGAFALGLIDEYEHSELNLIRKIRNVFAHSKHGVSFQSEPIRGLCATLSSRMPSSLSQLQVPVPPRSIFANALVSLSLRMMYRDRWVSFSPTKKRNWGAPAGKPLDSGWRTFKDQKPEPGQVYVMYKLDKDGNMYPSVEIAPPADS